jgi:hypothetical protein
MLGHVVIFANKPTVKSLSKRAKSKRFIGGENIYTLVVKMYYYRVHGGAIE